ncbi:MAG TPA: prolyl oligopeptidase family serine peptidase [Archangium sp.]|uniref:alpha/beta hydrolase family protein n=1 Tax=Archangium sp. TaxID=1872627 RepID=UPI002E32E78A|nr:prolyl oligopeptidase family serine peptidase [Archangium sp.]HEX5749047.1 prolyl oligopeptidase family serine peptidase [Archangium sp.]
MTMARTRTIPAWLGALLALWLTDCAHPEKRPAEIPAPVLGAHPDANSPDYVGAPLVTGSRSPQELYAAYPRREPDPRLATRLAEILADGGKTLRWSATGSVESFQHGEVTIPLVIRVPPPCENTLCPVIVFFNGACAPLRYHWRPEFFLRAGFIFVEPHIRGDRCDEAWADADNGPRKPEAQTDIEACGHYVRTRFSREGRTPKVGILGWSYGGNQALVGMTRFAGAYDAGFALAAKTDLYSFFKNAPEDLRKARAREYGDPDTEPDLLRSISPITYVDRLQGPLALMLGGRDPKVSLSDADAFVRKARAHQREVSLMIVPEHGHLTEQPREIVFEHAHVIQFFSDSWGRPVEFH